MTENNPEILQLRFNGNDINPQKVKPSEIADLIKQFEGILLSTIEATYPEINPEHLLFTFEGVKNESLGINFSPVLNLSLPAIKNAVIASYTLVTTAIHNQDYSLLPNKAIDNLKNISKFSKLHKCNADFNLNGKTVSTITPTTEIQQNKNAVIKSTINIYGEIIDVGSNIHLKLNDGSVVYVDTEKTTSKILAPRLWEQVGLRGTAKWDASNSKITEFKLTEVLDYNPGSIVNAFNELREITSGVWDSYNTNDEINKQLLRE